MEHGLWPGNGNDVNVTGGDLSRCGLRGFEGEGGEVGEVIGAVEGGWEHIE